MVYQIGQMAKISPAFLQRLSDTACCIAQMYKVELKNLFEKYSCRVRTAHQPLKAPEGIKRVNSECDRDLEGV